MKNIVRLLSFSILLSSFLSLTAQNVENPNFAVTSHPITIEKIIRTPENFIIQLSLENKMDNGYFCASKTIYIQDIKTGRKLNLDHSEGVPVCPDTYHFKWIGEKLRFSLYFPPLDSSVQYVNVIEECSANCLFVYGLIINQKINNEINQGFDAYTHKNLPFALESFKKAIQQLQDYPYGYLYGHVIKILLGQKKYEEAKVWFQKLQASDFIDKDAVLKQVAKYEGASKFKNR